MGITDLMKLPLGFIADVLRLPSIKKERDTLREKVFALELERDVLGRKFEALQVERDTLIAQRLDLEADNANLAAQIDDLRRAQQPAQRQNRDYDPYEGL